MNRKISLGAALTLAIMFALVTFVMTMIYSLREFDTKVFSFTEREQMYEELAEVDRIIRQNYLNVIDEDMLNASLIQGYVDGIGDIYARYMTAEEYAELQKNNDGRMVGIGATVEINSQGYMRVVGVTPDSPADLAGIMIEDIIFQVDDLAVSEDTFEAASDALNGEPGTIVKLWVRQGEEEVELEVTRRLAETVYVEYKSIDNIGYIKINEFTDSTVNQFSRAINNLMNEEKVSAIIYDVRDNPGGTLDSVCEILDIILPEGDIVSAVYKNGESEVIATSDASSIELPMAVLINSKTASAAELFAQALKDYDKADTVGETSFGKGTLQNIYSLNDGGALEITIAHFHTSMSGSFEGIGIKPDYEVVLSADLAENLSMLDETNDPQIIKALELLEVTLKNIAGNYFSS